MASLPQTAPQPQYALRFISGKYQGGEFPLRMDREIEIGRSSDLDMVLVEDMVSRRHAKISTRDGEIVIEDLKSTNGTFVNGEKVAKAQLKEGDRILIGTSIIKLVVVEGTAAHQALATTEAEARAKLQHSAERGQQNSVSRSMSGEIEEIPLPDLLQLLSTSKKTGVLTIRGPRGVGKIYMRKGQIYYCTIDDNFAMRPQKAMYRLLTWEKGTFELEPPDERQVIEEIEETTEMLLMEGMRQMDEVMRVKDDAPRPEAHLAVPTPLAGKLRDLAPEELDAFQLVLDHGTMQGLLDNFPGTDLDAYTHILSLLKKEFVVIT